MLAKSVTHLKHRYFLYQASDLPSPTQEKQPLALSTATWYVCIFVQFH